MDEISAIATRPSLRLFQDKSTRVTVVLLAILALAIPGYWGLTHAQADASTPSVDYQFNGNLTDSASGSSLTVTPTCPNPVLNVPDNQCIATSAFGSDGDGPYWTWTAGSPTRRGGGFTVVTNSPLTKTYTIALKFSFASMPSGWAKIIDYKNKVTDDGFYFKNGKLQFYPQSPAGATYTANQVLDLVITRDDATTTKPFTVYARTPGGALQTVYQINDTSDLAVPATINAGSNSVLGFFFDDNATSAEATTVSDGRVTAIFKLAGDHRFPAGRVGAGTVYGRDQWYPNGRWYVEFLCYRRGWHGNRDDSRRFVPDRGESARTCASPDGYSV